MNVCLQTLLPSREEGADLVSRVTTASERVLGETAVSGQPQLRRETETLTFEWQRYCSRLSDAEAGLEAALDAWRDYDKLHDELSAWLRDVETTFADQTLQPSLVDKQAQILSYKVSRT